MTGWMGLLLVTIVLVVAALVFLCVTRARRLDRLHIRVDAARAGLESALDRRAVVARWVAAVPGSRSPPELAVTALAALSAGAEREVREGSENAENALTRCLAAVDRAGLDDELLEELADAEQLVILARRVHNDAVRDTLGLRSRRLVRWLRLAGTAPVPAYFEIADPEPQPEVAHPSPSETGG
ncbi:MAG: NUDIX hydrolase [Pseudonocardia sp.]